MGGNDVTTSQGIGNKKDSFDMHAEKSVFKLKQPACRHIASLRLAWSEL